MQSDNALAPKTILFIEDEPALRALMSNHMGDLGYDVVAVGTGAAALELIDSGLGFDLLLSDIVMPGDVGGMDLARHLARDRPDVPVILLSGYAATDQTNHDIVTHFLRKPCSPRLLADTLKRVLEGALEPSEQDDHPLRTIPRGT